MKAQNPATPILRKVYKTETSHKSVSYTVVYKEKFGFRDTVTLRAKVKMLPNIDTFIEGHPVYDAYLWSSGDSEMEFYTIKNSYDINLRSKTVIKSTYPKTSGKQANPIHINRYVQWADFIHPKDVDTTLWALLNDTVVLLNDTLIVGMPCWHIIEKMHEFGFESKGLVYNLYISKRDYTPLLTVKTSLYFGMPFYSYFFMTNVVFDKVTVKDFSTSQIPKDFKIEYFREEEQVKDSTDRAIEEYINLYKFKKERDYERQKSY